MREANVTHGKVPPNLSHQFTTRGETALLASWFGSMQPSARRKWPTLQHDSSRQIWLAIYAAPSETGRVIGAPYWWLGASRCPETDNLFSRSGYRCVGTRVWLGRKCTSLIDHQQQRVVAETTVSTISPVQTNASASRDNSDRDHEVSQYVHSLVPRTERSGN